MAFLLGRSLLATILQTRALKTNPFAAHVIPGRVTAQLPVPRGQDDDSTPQPRSIAGNFGHVAAATPLVTFHLGIRFHHPLGLLAPGAREMGTYFEAMREALASRRDEFGVVSTSLWRGTEASSQSAIMLVAYFTSAAALNRFAHDPVHRDGWDWYHRLVREQGCRHFGLFHETFVSRPGEWETIYMDCEPTLLGAGNVRVRDGAAAAGQEVGEREKGEGVVDMGVRREEEEEEEEQEWWIRPIVSADHPALKSQAKRMGMTLGIHEDLERNEV